MAGLNNYIDSVEYSVILGGEDNKNHDSHSVVLGGLSNFNSRLKLKINDFSTLILGSPTRRRLFSDFNYSTVNWF